MITAHDTPLPAKAATTPIPIVFASGGDPVKLGLLASLDRPGANVTGVTFVVAELGAKRLGLLHELQPGAVRVGVLVASQLCPRHSPLSSDVQAGKTLTETLEADFKKCFVRFRQTFVYRCQRLSGRSERVPETRSRFDRAMAPARKRGVFNTAPVTAVLLSRL